MELINNLIEKYYRQKKSIFLTIVISVLLGVLLFSAVENIVYKIIGIICIMLIEAYYIIDTIKYNKLPVANEEYKAAVLIRIFAKNKEEYDDIKYKFGNEFEKFLVDENNKKFTIIYIPYHLNDKYKSNNEDDIINLLKKTNCVFLTTIKTKSEELDKDTQYVTEFNLGIMHPTYRKDIQNIFQREFNILGSKTSRIEYSKKEKIKTLEITAQKISLICQYIIGRAYYLNREMEDAKSIGDKLYKRIKNITNSSVTKELTNMVRCLCYDTHIFIAAVEFSRENKNLELIENELKSANEYIKNTYQYNEGMSVYTFLKDRDINKVKYYLGCCKAIDSNGSWKYSEAFLSAYIGETEGRVIYKYMQALKVPHNHMDLIYFIEDILAKEDKNMLRFALFILYVEMKEYETAKKILKEYLENKQEDLLEENTLNKLSKRYGKNLVNEICKTNK